MRARHPVLKSPHLSRALRLTGHLLVHHSHRASRTGSSAPAATAGHVGAVLCRPVPGSSACGGARAGDGDGDGEGSRTHMAFGCRRGSWSLLECAIRRRQAPAAPLNSSGSQRVLRVSWKFVDGEKKGFVTVDRVSVCGQDGVECSVQTQQRACGSLFRHGRRNLISLHGCTLQLCFYFSVQH